MKFLVLILSLATATLARPGSDGYDYETPSGSYLPSSGQTILSSAINIPSGSYLPADSGSFLQGGITGNYNPGYVQDHKHVYFYAAPDDEAVSRLRVYISPAGQRNTKIIFIKAPSYGQTIPEVIAPPSLAEDKTLVYVLVKKPEHHGAISIPASATVKQARPEVYFIKYRNQNDGQASVEQTLSGHPAGRSLEQINSASFIRTLGTSYYANGYNDGAGLLGGGIGSSGNGYFVGSSGFNGNGYSGSKLLSSTVGSIGYNGNGVGRYADGADGYHY